MGNVIDQGAISKVDGFRKVLDTSERGGIFEFDFRRPELGKQANDIWLSGWFHWGWYADDVKVARVDMD